MIGVEITAGEWLLVCLAGALLGLDGIAWPQAMWSRPVAAGTIGGLLFGAPAHGFLAGAWLEIVTSRHPPFGAARYPETGPAALLAGSAYALSEAASLGALIAAVLVGWAVGWIGMHSIAWLRTVNSRLVADAASLPGGPGEVVGRHRTALRLDALRGAALCAALFIPSLLAVRLVETFRPDQLGTGPAVALAAIGLAGLAGCGARALGTRRDRWGPVVMGIAAGLVLAWLVA